MKTKLFFLIKVFSLTALAFLLGVFAFAQTGSLPPVPGPESGLPDFLSWTELLYGALVSISAYLSAFIPGINNIKDKAWRVVAIAIIIASIFLIKGWSSALGIIFAYLSAVSFYDLIFSKWKKTPATKEEFFTPEVSK